MPTIKHTTQHELDYDSDDVLVPSRATGSVNRGCTSVGCILGVFLLVTLAVVGTGVGVYFYTRKPEPAASTQPAVSQPAAAEKQFNYKVEKIAVSNQNEASGCFAVFGDERDEKTNEVVYVKTTSWNNGGARECRAESRKLLVQTDSYDFKVQLAEQVIVADQMCKRGNYRNNYWSKVFGEDSEEEICNEAWNERFVDKDWELYEDDRKMRNARALVDKIFESYLSIWSDERALLAFEVEALKDAAQQSEKRENIRLSKDLEKWDRKSVAALNKELSSDSLEKLYKEGFACGSESKDNNDNYIIHNNGFQWSRMCIRKTKAAQQD